MPSTRLLALLFFAPALAHAVVPQDQVPVRALGAGRTRAFAQGLDALVLNPAGLGAATRFEADLQYTHVTATDTAKGGDGVGAWVADSPAEGNVAGALGYRYLSAGNGAAPVRGGIADLGLSYRLVPQVLVGGRLSYLSYQTGGRDVHDLTADLGAMALLGPAMVGITGFNLLPVDAPEAARGVDLAAGLSDHHLYRVGADVRWEWLSAGATASFAAGGEYLLGEAVPVRAGVEWDRVRERVFLSFGAGWLSPTWGFELAARRDLDSGETLVSAALKFFET